MAGTWLRAGVVAMAACALPVVAAVAADAQDTSSAPAPVALLARGARASKSINYEGVLLYRSANAMEVLRVVHRYQDGSESEHLITLTGPPQELIRQGDRLTCILPRDRRLSLQRPSVKSFLTRLDGPTIKRLEQWYEFKSLGSSRVAGRDCVGVVVEPKDAYRYGYEVWLDSKTDLPLRVVLMGNDKRVLEQVMFTEIRFPASIPDQAFAPQVPQSAGFKIVTQKLAPDTPIGLHDAGGPARWRFSALPPGFEVTMRDERDMPDGVGRVEHIMVSDGLSAVSVFSAKARPADPGFEGLTQMGAVRAYGRSLDGYHITVVGEAPARTVQMIGDDIEPVAATPVTALKGGAAPVAPTSVAPDATPATAAH